DGLNALSENIGLLDESHGDIILTPHPVEMARLCGEKVPSDDKGREEIAAGFAKKYGVTVLLKGHRTVIASPKGEVHINESGNSGMASGGMGDVLTGIIASLCGQGVEAYNAAVLGAFIHGLAGDIAADDKGQFGMIASDVIDKLPYAISAIDAYSAAK
ncbi:MAG: NAD(P)H-hydrate dehydratase, partial [Clostridia bacterium]|nr:NAD(P)H-hydrate dehydratase [Clostridia bacterium]